MKTTKTILCVDDEINILHALKRLLRKEGYTIHIASSGPEGLALFEQKSIDLVISDYRMPEMTGIEFLQHVQILYPQTIRMILSGYADTQSTGEMILQVGISQFLTKPWDDTELKQIIQQCFDREQIHP